MLGGGRVRVPGQTRQHGTITLCIAHVAASMSIGSSTEIKSHTVPEASDKASPCDRVNILMVDDQPGKLLTYEAILSDLGENLIITTSPKEAGIGLLMIGHADAVMDVSMPGIDGFERAQTSRPLPRYQKT